MPCPRSPNPSQNPALLLAHAAGSLELELCTQTSLPWLLVLNAPVVTPNTLVAWLWVDSPGTSLASSGNVSTLCVDDNNARFWCVGRHRHVPAPVKHRCSLMVCCLLTQVGSSSWRHPLPGRWPAKHIPNRPAAFLQPASLCSIAEHRPHPLFASCAGPFLLRVAPQRIIPGSHVHRMCCWTALCGFFLRSLLDRDLPMCKQAMLSPGLLALSRSTGRCL